MANNSPTLVMASLSDDQLKKSIDSLVTHVDEAMKKMVQSTNNAVGEMEAKLKSLGSLKIDSGSSNDGGTGRRTQQHEKLTKAVNDASEAVSKETQKLQDLQQSLSGASDREQNFISQKERAANTIAQENELLSKQQSELAALKTQQQSFVDAEQRDIQAKQQNAAAIEKQRGAVKYYEEEIVSLQERLTSAQAKIDRFYEVQAKARESISSRLHAPSDQFIGYNDYERGKSVYSKTEQDVRSLIKALSELDNADKKHGFGDELRRAYMNLTPSQDMANVFKRQQEEISSYIKTLQEAKKGTKGETRANLDNQILAGKELLAIYKELGNAQNALNKTVQKEGLRDGGNVGGIKRDIEETQKAYGIAKQKLDELTQSSQQSSQASQQKAQIDAQVAAKEKEIAETKGRIATATREQTEAEKNASQAAREKANIQSQVANQEKQVAEAKKQLTTATQQQAEVEKQSVQNIAQQTAARDKQIKQNQETAMSFDQIAAALSKARQTVSEFNTKRASGILPSSEDYKRYEQALARIVEYNDKLKQSALSRADANQWANVFDAKRVISDMSAVDDRYKKLVADLKTQQAESAKAFNQQMRDAFKMPTANVDEVWKKIFKLRELLDKGTKSEFISSTQIKNVENLISKLHDMRREMESKAVPQSVANYIKRVGTVEDQLKLAFARANKISTDQLDLAQAKLERLQVLLRDMRERGILNNAQIASTEAEIRKLEQIIGQVNTAQQQTTQSAQRYTEEIRKQAAAIRATKEWQEKGHVVIGDVNYYDKERANVSKRDKQLLLSLEEQIVQTQQKETQEALAAAEAKRQQAQAAKEAAQASKGVSAYDLGIDPNVSAGRQRQIESTRAASKETEYLKQQVASLLEVEEREVKSVNMTTASYSELSQHLKQLQSAYNKLGADRIKKGEGVDIANEIQRTQRAMQKLQQTMSRPISLKDALGGSEKTLDDLAYKMRRLQSYRGGLNFKTQSDEVARVNQKYAELQKKMDVIMERNQRMIASNNTLGRSWNYMKNRLAFYVTVGAGTSFVKQLIDIRSQYEMNEKALGILLDSASRGTRIFNELSQMALVSPYTLIELSNAAKQLTAYDIAAKDVVDTTRRLADMASAVGVPVERLTYALGQIKAYGYLNSRDARMFANAGIPLVKQLADRYSELEGKMVSTADVYDRMKKKAIDYNDVMAVINKMTDEGGKFFDFQAKMAETLKVRLANLTLAWNNMLNDMGKDNQGVMTTGLKGLTVMFKHWRELYRIISTVIVAIGAYKAASMLVGIATSRAVSSTIPAWFRLANIVRTTQGNMALLGLTMRSIPFTAWFTAIATLASYFILFNNSSDDVKQKLEDIKSAFDGVRKEVETLFADAIKTDNIGTQLTKLRDMLELAETELGVTIPIRLEDVNESNIKQKLKEAKRFVDGYINFSQTFSEAAAGTKFNELMNDFGSKARSTYTNVTESINSVVVALQELSDKGQASKRDIEILNELTSGQKEDESRIEYLQRLVSLYEELGLIGQKKVTPKISFFGSSENNIEELEQQQENALNRLGIKNKSVFENMLKDVQGYYSSSSIAAYQFEQQVMRVAEKIDINNIPVEQRTMKLTAAINEEASQNNWNQFEKEFARQIANKKFGTTIEISDESKKAAEEDLQAWQRNIQNWAKNNGITFDVSFQTNDTEASYAKRMLQDAKDAKELWETLRRKEKQGTGSKDATTKAYNDYIEKRKLAAAAGADLSSLDGKRKSSGSKKDPLLDALKQEISLVEKLQSDYDKLSKSGASQSDALDTIRGAYGKTIRLLNAQLGKYGLPQLDISQLITDKDPNKALAHFKQTLDTLVRKGMLTLERSKELEAVVEKFTLSAKTYNLDMITKGLNNELGKLKDEYELAVELDANPELGGMFLDMFGIDKSALSSSIDEYMFAVQNEFRKKSQELGYSGWGIDVFKANEDTWKEWGKNAGLSDEALGQFKAKFVEAQNVVKKWAQDVVKQTQDLQYKLADNNGKIAIEEKKLAALRQSLAQETNDKQKALLELQIQDQQNAINKLKEEILQLLPTYNRLFGEVAEHSASMTRKLARDYKNMLVDAQKRGKNPDGTYTVIDPVNGKSASITEERLGKEIKNANKELGKTDNIFKKIKESFKKGEDGIIDWVGGVENIGEAIGQVGDLVDTIGNVYDMFGNPNEYDATSEALHDIATTMQGVNTAAKGIGQIASGDYIGGAMSVISGLSSAISTWFDNGDKEILQQIKESELAVKRLENAIKDLQDAAEHAYGAVETGAQRAVIANKELQLIELKRQIQLEKSRDSKDRDDEKIANLEGQYKELLLEIKNGIENVVNEMLGISSAGDAVTQLVESMIEAFKNGEDAMKAFSEKWDEMIDNMILKLIVSEYMKKAWDKVMQTLNKKEEEFLAKSSSEKAEAQNLLDAMERGNDKERAKLYTEATNKWWNSLAWRSDSDYRRELTEEANRYMEALRQRISAADAANEQASEDYLKWSLEYMMGEGRDYMEGVAQNLIDGLGDWYAFGQDKDKTLSALQQGIQGITEDTAGALEAITNGISQQCYLQSDILIQIRDTVQSFDIDIQTASLSQILLQLQSSYQLQQSMLLTMENWTNPSGNAVRVELMS